MSKHLQRDLEDVKREILIIGGMVENAIQLATTALLDRREDLAEQVIDGDAEIDHKEVSIEEECLKILALHQPVASDLRFIIVVLKVNNDLERMGDLAVNIAERAEFFADHDPLPIAPSMERMVARVLEMTRKVLNALVNVDPEAARTVLAMDDEVDAIHRQNFDDLQALMYKDSGTIQRGIHVLSASRNLERIADQATNIAEDILFMVEGEIQRHRLRRQPAR